VLFIRNWIGKQALDFDLVDLTDSKFFLPVFRILILVSFFRGLAGSSLDSEFLNSGINHSTIQTYALTMAGSSAQMPDLNSSVFTP